MHESVKDQSRTMSEVSLSVIIPCYNEENTLAEIVGRVLEANSCGLELSIIIVDDASSDNSVRIAAELVTRDNRVQLIQHPKNTGKGAAVRTGFTQAKGDIILIQDADLEYNPSEFPRLLEPILEGDADVVYGSRFRGGDRVRILYFWHALGNKFLTLLSNMFTDLSCTDMETCYKLFRREIVEKIQIKENRFGFEPEITAKIAHMKPMPRVYEVGISYTGRTYQEGKKIGWKDGLKAIYCIVRYNLFR